MEFIMENYIWFIIGGVVVLMTIIGYIADKTNFTKKEDNKQKIKQSKKNKIEEVKEEVVEVEPTQETREINPIEDFSMDDVEPAFVTDEPEVVEEKLTLNENLAEQVSEEEAIDLVQNEEMYDMNTDEKLFEQPIDEFNEKSETVEETIEQPTEEANEELDATEEDLYVGLDGTPNAYKEDDETKQDENLEIELPSISSLDSELKEETDEDDVWKF